MSVTVANRIIERTNAQNDWRWENGKPKIELTGRRLQKIVYLTKLVWSMEHDECPMIKEDFHAWPSGPVIPELYDVFKVYQECDMCPRLDKEDYVLNDEEKDIINRVVDNTTDIHTEAIIDFLIAPDTPHAQVYDPYCTSKDYPVIPDYTIVKYAQNPDNQDLFFKFIEEKNVDRSIVNSQDNLDMSPID